MKITLEDLVTVLMASPVHKRWSLESIIRVFFPPILLGQYYARRDAGGKLVCLVTWALMDKPTSEKYVATHKVLPHEWNNGQNLWFMDAISPTVSVAELRKDMQAFFLERGFTRAYFLRSRDKARRLHVMVNTRAPKEMAA